MTDCNLLAGPQAIADTIRHLDAEDVAAVPLLDTAACGVLAAESLRLPGWRPARPVVGEGAATVYQDFELTVDIPPGSAVRALGDALESTIAAALAMLDPSTLPGGFRVNDYIVQRYPVGSAGMSPHRDHVRYVGLVAIVVVQGAGRFMVCADRAGTGSREIPSRPGDLLLMRAPGLFGRRDRPFHYVRDIAEERIILGLRQESGRP